MATLVLGMGNPILSDDGIGFCVAEAVRESLADAPDVAVGTASLGGLALMEAMLGYEHVILIDALLRPNPRPGAIHRLTLDDLRALSPTEHSASPHDTSVVTALELGRQVGLPVPRDVVIYAVEVANVLDFSDRMTPAVAEAVPEVAEAVLQELQIG
ncbi:MAG: hydrogenase maturation protease [Chloroflexaceae bacterium]|jgi:hydrogenase maturation protease|nr:hydrogenase maturation protease [Chloroflexaceae bacterium]